MHKDTWSGLNLLEEGVVPTEQGKPQETRGSKQRKANTFMVKSVEVIKNFIIP